MGFLNKPRKAFFGFVKNPIGRIMADLDPQKNKVTHDPKQNDVPISGGVRVNF